MSSAAEEQPCCQNKQKRHLQPDSEVLWALPCEQTRVHPPRGLAAGKGLVGLQCLASENETKWLHWSARSAVAHPRWRS